MRKVQWLIVLGVVFGLVAFGASLVLARPAAVTVTITDEVSGNNNAGRTAAAALNDQWITDTRNAGFTCFYQLQSIFAGGFFTYTPGTQAEITGTIGPIAVSISNRDMTNFSDVNDVGQLSGNVVVQSSLGKSLQDGAPMPDPDPAAPGGTRGWYKVSDGSAWEYWNETSGDNNSRNAVLFTFSPPVPAFGAFFGDVETRTDGNGTPAELRYKLHGGSVVTQTIPTSTTDQNTCGGTTPGCGNNTTRWIGLRGDGGETFEWVLVIVGDDDNGGTGNTEHISWVGATVALAPSGGSCSPGKPGPTAVTLASLESFSPAAVRWPVVFLALLLGGVLSAFRRLS